jgi:hypothetical protein
MSLIWIRTEKSCWTLRSHTIVARRMDINSALTAYCKWSSHVLLQIAERFHRRNRREEDSRWESFNLIDFQRFCRIWRHNQLARLKSYQIKIPRRKKLASPDYHLQHFRCDTLKTANEIKTEWVSDIFWEEAESVLETMKKELHFEFGIGWNAKRSPKMENSTWRIAEELYLNSNLV